MQFRLQCLAAPGRYGLEDAWVRGGAWQRVDAGKLPDPGVWVLPGMAQGWRLDGRSESDIVQLMALVNASKTPKCSVEATWSQVKESARACIYYSVSRGASF